MRRALTDAGFPGPAWAIVTSATEVSAFAEAHGWPVVLKTSRGGYDGRGVWVVRDAAHAAQVLEGPLADGACWLAEQHVPFVRELSAQVAERQARNAEVRVRNAQLRAEIKDLQEGTEIIEERARRELGMVKPDEILIQYPQGGGRPASP